MKSYSQIEFILGEMGYIWLQMKIGKALGAAGLGADASFWGDSLSLLLRPQQIHPFRQIAGLFIRFCKL